MSQKYRRLRRDELEEVRPQFVKFLAVNGIDGASWTRIKADDPKRTDALLLQFSQIVFQGVIDKVEYLLQRSKRDLRTYHCQADKIVMNGMMIEGTTDLDLSNENISPEEMLRQMRASGASVKLYAGERKYRDGDRDQDIFLLMEQGALISDDHMFRTLEKLKG
ncbi:hypothetical protein CEQ90_02250 [Lewinellaceae bacterium SD302]|nr:hypothetical protein CEQ90_02250 [Lewinellaceae bacterium SD302]